LQQCIEYAVPRPAPEHIKERKETRNSLHFSKLMRSAFGAVSVIEREFCEPAVENRLESGIRRSYRANDLNSVVAEPRASVPSRKRETSHQGRRACNAPGNLPIRYLASLNRPTGSRFDNRRRTPKCPNRIVYRVNTKGEGVGTGKPCYRVPRNERRVSKIRGEKIIIHVYAKSRSVPLDYV
jgi:hypothetical protein